MKKVLLILLSMALVLSMAGAVAGATTTYDKTISGNGQDSNADAGGSSTAVVTYSIHNTYVVKVPSTFTFSKTTVDNQEAYTAGSSMYAKITTIGPGEYLNVTMTGSNEQNDDKKWYLKSSADDSIFEYYVDVTTDSNSHISLQNGSPKKSGDVVLSIPATDYSEKTHFIHMRLVDPPTSAAEYTDTITFKVTIGR